MFGLANRLGVGVLRSLAAQVKAIFAKPGIDGHLYTFGPGVPILGPELVVNGDFSNGASGWTLGTGWGVYSGAAQYSGNGTWMEMAVPTVAGQKYRVMFGNSGPMFGGVWTSPNQSGAIVSGGYGANALVEFVASGSISYVGWAGGAAYTVDNASVKLFSGYSNTYSGFVAGNYFDSAGISHASVDGSVGAVLDAAGSVGAEIAPNGYATITNLGGGQYRVEANTTGRLYFDLAQLSNGATYLIEFNVDSFTGSNTFNADWCDVVGGIPTTALSAGKKSFIASRPTYDSTYRFLDVTVGAGSTMTISGITIKRVTGIHASQGTPGYKPTLRKGIVNLLTWSNDLTNGAWVIANGASKSGQTLTLSNNFGSKVQQFSSAIALGGTCTAAFVLSGTPGVQVQIGVMDNGGAFPQSNTQVTLTATPTLYAITRPATTQAQVIPYIQDYGSATTVTVGACGLFQGTLTAAQILAAGGIPLTTTAPASSQAGVNYLEFGGDDYLASAPLAQVGDDYYECIAVAVDADFAGYPFISSVGTGTGYGRIGDIYVDPSGALVGRSVLDANVGYFNNSGVLVQRGVPFVAEVEKISGMARVGVNGVFGPWSPAPTSGVSVTEARLGLVSAIRVFDRAVIKGQVSDTDKSSFRKQAAAAAGIQL